MSLLSPHLSADTTLPALCITLEAVYHVSSAAFVALLSTNHWPAGRKQPLELAFNNGRMGTAGTDSPLHNGLTRQC